MRHYVGFSQIGSHMWPDLRKAGFHAHNSKAHFSPSNNSCTRWLTIQPGSYWCWKLPGLLLLWLVSEVCQMSTASTSVQVAFKWLHIPLASRQLAVIHHTTGWWVWPLIYLTALCDMWRWKWHQWMPFGCFWWRRSLCPPLRGYPPSNPVGVLLVLATLVKNSKTVEIQLAIHPIVGG